MAVVFEMVFIFRTLSRGLSGFEFNSVMFIHFACIPAARTGDCLRPPVEPDAKLGVTEPFGIAIIFPE